MAAVTSRNNPLLDRRGFQGPKSPFPIRSPAILLDKAVKRESIDSGSAQTPRARALSDPPPSSDAKLLRTSSSRSNFDLEPNPFEQSFSASPHPSSVRSTARDEAHAEHDDQKPVVPARRARSQSPTGVRTPGGSAVMGASASGGKLPSLASIVSPQVTGSALHHLGWPMDHSTLRSGPLSPAMLHGPTPGSSAVGFSSFANWPGFDKFDPAAFRTGLTPSITGQPSAAPFLPNSPASQAMFNMMFRNGDTPNAHGGTTAAGVAHPLHAAAAAGYRSERDLPNHFDLGFANVLDGKPAVPEHPPMQLPDHAPLPVTAMSMGPMFATQPAPKPIALPGHSPLKNGHLAPPGPPQMPPMPPMPYLAPTALTAPHPAAAAAGFPPGAGQNPLFLLTQAQQELHTEDDHIAAGLLSGLGASPYAGHDEASPASLHAPLPYVNGGGGAPQHSSPIAAAAAAAEPPASATSASSAPTTRKRKAAHVPTVIEDEVPIPPPAPRGRRKGTGKKQKRNDDDDDDEDEAGGARRPETEEEKRKNFLERNRQAALKCRQRKKAWLSNLQAKVEYLTADNETLQTTVQALRDEIAQLRTLLIVHKDCPASLAGGPGGAPPGAHTVADFLAASQRPLPERPQPPPQTQFT